MDLSNVYSLRRNFVLIGLTGRTGSGCTKIAELLSGDFNNLKKGLRDSSDLSNKLFKRKYSICFNYFSEGNNWSPFVNIAYKDVILFFLLSKIGGDLNSIEKLLQKFYKEHGDDNVQTEDVNYLISRIKAIHNKHDSLIRKIRKYNGNFKDLRKDKHLNKLNNRFFGSEFKELSKSLFNLLSSKGYFKRTMLLHRVANNIRRNGDPIDNEAVDINSIYLLAHLMNRLIKAKKHVNKRLGLPTKITIDSLRNSLEIMFFKERYSGFYMVSTKDSKHRAQARLQSRLERVRSNIEEPKELTRKLLDLDSVEYKTKDFGAGKFYAPDVENCIQKSDIHILNRKIDDIVITEGSSYSGFEKFYTREEQLMKLVALISQPGIITPSSIERCMHMAHTSKSNSGCISRQVGAVITNKDYSIRSIGWNDVPAGVTPCNLRNARDFFKEESLDSEHYSDFERGINLEETEYKYKEKHPYNFKEAVKDYFKESEVKIESGLNGKNCAFCFKTIHNKYEEEKNQVHTRSLHAEENAMLQIPKYGGQALKGGKLFTTASPCELCAKKAFQLGVSEIYYIDPYPGISKSQILYSGSIDCRPTMLSFNGVIGKSYHKLYEPFMAYKDEVNLMLGD